MSLCQLMVTGGFEAPRLRCKFSLHAPGEAFTVGLLDRIKPARANGLKGEFTLKSKTHIFTLYAPCCLSNME